MVETGYRGPIPLPEPPGLDDWEGPPDENWRAGDLPGPTTVNPDTGE
jgi:hypothetical protein